MERIGNLLRNLPSETSAPGCDPADLAAYLQEKVAAYNDLSGDLDKEDGYHCDLCHNKGHLFEVRESACGIPTDMQVPCRCTRVRNALRRLRLSGLESVVKRYTFDAYQAAEPWQQAIKEKALRFCQDEKHGWFFIGGQTGAGKSHICTAIAVHYIRQGLDTRYMLWQQELDRIKAAALDGDTTLMRELKNAPVLYVDDLFKAGHGDGVRENQFSQADVKRTFELLNHRYMNPHLVTIISSEQTIDELAQIDEAFAGRIAERANEDGCGYCICLDHDTRKNWRMAGVVRL